MRYFPFLMILLQSFKRLPTTVEWARFRKYARRMRELSNRGTPSSPSLEVLSVIQSFVINEPLFPNLKTFCFLGIEEMFIPFIHLFLSPITTSINLSFKSNLPKATVASMVMTLPILCPNLQAITLGSLRGDPTIAAAVSGMLLVANRNALRLLSVECPLTEEASEVICKLPNLRSLSVVVGRRTSLPPASLPGLAKLVIKCDNEDGWPRLFHGATFGKLESVTFYPRSEEIGDFLGAFERAALSSSLQNTLSRFYIPAQRPWNPTYSSLLPFTQLVDLEIGFSCDGGCSSRVDDDIVIGLSRAMPKLKYLALGDAPCGRSTTGITTKGLLTLAHHCPKLWSLRVHLQVASLSEPSRIPGMVRNAGPAASWTDCTLTDLSVGKTPVPERSAMTIALTLLRIFPRLDCIMFIDEGWEEVENAINCSREIIDCSSKQHPLTIP